MNKLTDREMSFEVQTFLLFYPAFPVASTLGLIDQIITSDNFLYSSLIEKISIHVCVLPTSFVVRSFELKSLEFKTSTQL